MYLSMMSKTINWTTKKIFLLDKNDFIFKNKQNKIFQINKNDNT